MPVEMSESTDNRLMAVLAVAFCAGALVVGEEFVGKLVAGLKCGGFRILLELGFERLEFLQAQLHAFNALVGQIMKASKGKANPQQVNELLRKKIG